MSTLIAAYFFFRQSYALPVVFFQRRSEDYVYNATAKADPSWVSPPSVRATYDLILGCMTTLLLCAWTAFHPNIDPRNGATRTFFRRLGWIIATACFPEVILYCAWEQRWCAAKLRDEINALGVSVYNGHGDIEIKVLDPPRPSRVNPAPGRLGGPTRSMTGTSSVYSQPDATSKSSASVGSGSTAVSLKYRTPLKFIPWTLEQASFAVSGGFAVDSSSFWHRPQLTFTPEGVLKLAKLGVLPDVPDTTVQDKSKADVIAKILVCVQTTWFLIQCAARLIQKLPLTLLEIHVLINVVCIFVLYFVWMNKPYNAQRPVVCKQEKIVDLAAIWAVDCNLTRIRGLDADRRFESVKIEEVRAAHASSSNLLPRRSLFTRCFRSCSQKLSPHPSNNDDADPIGRYHLSAFADASPCKPTSARSPPPDVTARRMDEQLVRANRALDYLRFRHRATRLSFACDPATAADASWFRFPGTHVVFARSNLRVDGLAYRTIGGGGGGGGGDGARNAVPDERVASMHARPWPGAALVAAVYGAAHLAAWAARFPSPLEQWLWRGAALAVAGAPLAVGAALALVALDAWIWPTWSADRSRWSCRVLRRAAHWALWSLFPVLFVALCVVPAVAYPSARLYLLVEAFVGLRCPPAGAYRDVAWARYIPHAG